MTISTNPNVNGGSGEAALSGLVGLTLTAQTLRKRILRPYFETYRAAMMAMYPPVPNTGTVVYIDPTVAGPGAGTFADPLRVLPTASANTTYLFKERTRTVVTYSFTGGLAVAGVVLGTYSALDGSRVFEQERLATIDGDTYFRACIKWTGTSGNFTLSGLRVIGGYNATGAVTMFEANSGAPATSIVTIEYCVFESMGGYQVDGSGWNTNAAIAVNGPRTVGRFNRICVPGDGFSMNPGAGAGCQIICNDFIVPKSTNGAGPDPISVGRTGSNAVGKQVILGNWIDHQVNSKQGFLTTAGTPQSTGEETIFARNFMFGFDLSNEPLKPPSVSSGQIAYINDTTSVCLVVGNYFDQWCGWASVKNGLLAYNIGVLEHTDTVNWIQGFAAAAGGSGAILANNTVIGMNRTVAYDGKSIGLYAASGVGAVLTNNICINMEMKLGTGAVESYSRFVGTGPTDAANAAKALGTGSTVISDAMLDAVGRPLSGSPVFAPGVAVSFQSMPIRFPDIFGQTPWDTLSTFGAAQGWGGN